MPRFARKIVMLVLAAQVAWSLPVAVWMGYLWRTTDEADRSYPCRGGATCYSGPTTYLILMLAFGTMAVVVLIVMALLANRWRRRAELRARLLASGLQVPAVLVGFTATNTRINGRTLYKATFESRTAGVPIRVTERTTTTLPLGTRVSIVYDPADPSRATLAQDIDTLAAPGVFVDPDYHELARTGTGLAAMRNAVARNLDAALAELRAEVAAGRLTQQEYDSQRETWLRLVEMRTDQPLG